MAYFLKMPGLSQTSNEVRFIKWLVREGDKIEKGQPICEVETDKVITEVESAESGVILALIAEPETIIPEGQEIAVLGEKGEKLEREILNKISKIKERLVKTESEKKKKATKQEAKEEALRHKEQKRSIKAPESRKENSEARIEVKASPLVKNIARVYGINLEKIRGSGPRGLITKKDVENYIRNRGVKKGKTAIEDLREIGSEKLIWMYKKMVEIRQFEERIRFLFLEGKMPGTIHQYIGMEACAVGVCSALQKDDVIASTHRPHGHAIAKGLSIKEMMAELFGKSTGCCRGKGGSMHIGDLEKGMITAIAIVGANIPIVVGMALAFKIRGEKRVAVSFFGDGATNEGAFHEGLNMAAIYNVPAVFVCENNLYGASTPIKLVTKIENIADRGSAYGIRSDIGDGMDVIDVYNHAKRAIDAARAGQGPTLLEFKTFRLCGHSRRDPCNYMSDEEKAYWKSRDPIPNFEKRLLENGILSQEQLIKIKDEVEREIDEAVEFAEESPFPDPEDTLRGLYVSMDVPE